MSQYRMNGFQMMPPVVKNLLIINVLMYLATVVLGSRFNIDLNGLLGLHWVGSEKFEIYQLVTYMFMHGSFNHILFNMFAMWMFGSAIENYWGAKKFLIYYLLLNYWFWCSILPLYRALFCRYQSSFSFDGSILNESVSRNVKCTICSNSTGTVHVTSICIKPYHE